MKKFFKILSVLVLCLLAFVAGYFGYLNALVDSDHFFRIEQASASKEALLLEQQEKRLSSIIAARKRAFIARRDSLVQKSVVVSERPSSTQSSIGRQSESVAVFVERDPFNVFSSLEEAPGTFSREPDEPIRLARRAGSGAIEGEVDLGEAPGIPSRELDEPGAIEGGRVIERSQDELSALEEQLSVVQDRRKRLEVEKVNRQSTEQEVTSPFLSRLGELIDKRRELSSGRGSESVIRNADLSLLRGVDIVVQDRQNKGRVLSDSHSRQLAVALSVMPQGFDALVSKIYFVYGDDMRRGLSGYTSNGVVVFIKAEEESIVNVLFHEFGHVIGLTRHDDGGVRSEFTDGSYQFSKNDPMVRFFEISWLDDFAKKASSGFVSDYSKSSVHEDFAEAFIYYITHGNTLRRAAGGDGLLSAKKSFLESIFGGLEFFTGPESLFALPYDVTLLATDLESVLNLDSLD